MNKLLDKLPIVKQKITLYKQTLSTFFKELTDISNLWKDRDFLMNSSQLTYSLDNTLLNFSDFSFIPNEIQELLKKQGLFYKRYTLDINNNKYNIFLYYPSVQDEKSLRQVNMFFNKCIKHIFIWLQFVQPHIKNKCSNYLDVNILFSNHKKTLGEEAEILTPLHVNSAFTTSCKLKTSICIFRLEEWFKVFIHETFHCLGLDFSHQDTQYEDIITQQFKVVNDKGLRIYESYCEVWAQILNSVIISFLKTYTKEEFLNKFDILINNELKFALFQTCKILHYNNISYNDLIDINCKTILFREKTHTLSYYILKTLLLFNLKDFEKWCKQNNNTLLQFRSTNTNIKKFITLIITYANDIRFKTTIASFEENYSKMKISDIYKDTMRMTINDI